MREVNKIRHSLGVPWEATGVYVIRNLFDGKIYVGSSSESMLARCQKHARELERGIHGNYRLSRAWFHGGAESFEFSVIEICEKSACLCREQWWIDHLKPEYNIHQSSRSPLGRVQKPESIEKVRLANLGSKRSPEARAKMSAAAKGHKRCVGRVCSPETREKIRIGNLNRAWVKPKGIKLTEEAKEKLRQKALGRKASPETRKKMSDSHLRRFGKTPCKS